MGCPHRHTYKAHMKTTSTDTQPESMKGHRYIESRIHRADTDLVSVYTRDTCRCTVLRYPLGQTEMHGVQAKA